MRLTVQLFAVLRERAGAAELELEDLPEGVTVAQLKQELARLHPELGACTMGQLLNTWVVHDLHHIAQICKALARSQYTGRIGPWEAYVGILSR